MSEKKRWKVFGGAVKSPCPGCGDWGQEGFPECAETCEPMRNYRVYQGLPTEASEKPRTIQATGMAKNLFPTKNPEEFVPLTAEILDFLRREKEERGLTYGQLSERLSLSVPRLANILSGKPKLIRIDAMKNIRDYREAHLS
ncbi:MAG TPA: helix-turn-helix transcriptional regulator [Geothrix sp.]|nr:helix-turn-helix transcriptional regulator [Geothrix sp.]